MKMGYSIVGIDLGTSTTVVRVRNYAKGSARAQTKVLNDVNGESSFATVIFRREDGLSFYGSAAENMAGRQSVGEVLIRNFKMDLISPDEDKRMEAQELVVEFLEFIGRELDEQRCEVDLQDEVIVAASVPAKWPRDVRDFMREAIVRAEIVTDPGKVRIVDEPTAAAHAVLVARMPDLVESGILETGSCNVMMVDMGAGTTDLAVFRLNISPEGQLSVDSVVCYPPVGNPCFCGGREIDARLTEYAVKVGGESAERNRARLEYELKKMKENQISPAFREGIPCDLRDALIFSGPEYRSLEPMDRRMFERMTGEHWKNWRALVAGAIARAKDLTGIGPNDIDLLVLTGGHSAWYCVDELFAGRALDGVEPLSFAKLKKDPGRVLCEVNRSATVANGLALDDMPLPFVKTTANKYVLRMVFPGGGTSDQTVAEANEPLPCKRTLEFTSEIKDADPEQRMPIAVELLYEAEEGVLRSAVRTEVEVEPPDNLTRGASMRLIAGIRVEIDTDYIVYALGRVTAAEVDGGKLVGVPKLTEIKFWI